jgi:hypothetical protein
VVLNDTNQLKIHAKNHEIFYGSWFGWAWFGFIDRW